MLIEPPENTAFAPSTASRPFDEEFVLVSKLPLVATATPVAVMLEPAPVTNSACDPIPDVVTDPPLIVVCPPS